MVKLLKTLWAIIEEYFATRYEIVPAVEEPVVAPIMVEPVPNLATVRNFALAIESREGSIPPCARFPEGTPAWRNKNPGNCKGLDGNFLKFNTYEEGFAYLENYIMRVQRNEHRAYPKNPTILQYFNVYAPTADANDPESYAHEVATKLGVTTSFLVKDLV